MEDCGHIPVWTGQRVERTNARGRHTYCAPFKTWIIEQAMQPGMSMAGLAMRNQVNANQLRRWIQLEGRRGVRPKGLPTLLPVTVAPQDVRSAAALARLPAAAVEIEVAGTVVRVREGVSAATLQMVLNCLRPTP